MEYLIVLGILGLGYKLQSEQKSKTNKKFIEKVTKNQIPSPENVYTSKRAYNIFQEEQDKNIKIIEDFQKELYNKDSQYIIMENKFNNKTNEYQKQIEEIRKELKIKDEQYQNIENKFNKLLEEINHKDKEHQKQVRENKKLAINIYYYWKTAHNINPELISICDIIDGIYKHFYDTTFNIEKNNFSYKILEETLPFLIKKREHFFYNKILR